GETESEMLPFEMHRLRRTPMLGPRQPDVLKALGPPECAAGLTLHSVPRTLFALFFHGPATEEPPRRLPPSRTGSAQGLGAVGPFGIRRTVRALEVPGPAPRGLQGVDGVVAGRVRGAGCVRAGAPLEARAPSRDPGRGAPRMRSVRRRSVLLEA